MCNKNYEIIEAIAKKVHKHGGEAFYVGGYVRDKIMGIDSKDIDIEVHKISPDTLRSILNDTAPYSEIGKSFGIFSLHGYPIDIALPRKDIHTGMGHRGFDIEIDPFIGYYMAAKRRDFTINSMMQNILTNEIIDTFGGIDDINKKRIRHTCTETFSQDPLRVLRAAQFAARLDFEICKETIELSKKAALTTLSSERICEETRKALLNSKRPSIYFKYLKEMNQLSPWFEKLLTSDEKWENTMNSIDNAAGYLKDSKSPFNFMLSALVSHFETINDVKFFTKTLTNNNSVIKAVINAYTLLPLCLKYSKENSDFYATNKLFDEIIDKEGTILLLKSAFDIDKNTESFLTARLSHYYNTIKQIPITGKDLIKAGYSPDKNFSHLLKAAHNMYLAGQSKKEILANLKNKV